jgi:hypothetical protein
MIAFNNAQPNVKAAVFAAPVSPYDQQFNNLNTIGDMWLTATRFAPSYNFGVSGELGGTTAEFIADFKNKSGQTPASLDPVSSLPYFPFFFRLFFPLPFRAILQLRRFW